MEGKEVRRGNLVALLCGVLLVFAVEGLLVLGSYSPLAEEDPFIGFAGSRELFLEGLDGGGTYYYLNPLKERYFNTESFRMPKPRGTFRIIAFGGSTTYGRPFLGETSFPFWLADILSIADPSRRYEVINAGAISYASYRVVRLMEELSRFSPDLYVVYSGHNEFLEARTFEDLLSENPRLRRLRGALHHSRLYSALARGIQKLRRPHTSTGKTLLGDEVEATLEEVGGPELYRRDEVFRRGVIDQYRRNVEFMTRLAERKGVPLLLCTLPSNLSGMSPFKSEHRTRLGERERGIWSRTFAEAESAYKEGDLEKALSLLAKAETVDDGFAQLHFAKGLALLQLGRERKARESFIRAKEEDIIPLRALEIFNEAVRDAAGRSGAALADVEAAFREMSPGGIPGPNIFTDHVHPTIRGQQLVALVIADSAVKAGIVPLSSEAWRRAEPRANEHLATSLLSIPPRYVALGEWGVGRLFNWAGKYEEAYPSLLEAWKTLKNVPEIPRLLGGLELRRGNAEAARSYLLEALRLYGYDAASIRGLAHAYLSLDDSRKALDTLDRIKADDRGAPYLSLRGQALTQEGDMEGALRDLAEAVRLSPEIQGFRLALAKAQVLAGKDLEARESYRGALALQGREWSEEDYLRFRDSIRLLESGGPLGGGS